MIHLFPVDLKKFYYSNDQWCYDFDEPVERYQE